MHRPPRLAFSHMGFWVSDIARMERFYVQVLGFTVTDRGKLGSADLVFLSQDPREHHQIVLVSGRPAQVPFNVINQISLRAADLPALKEVYRRVRDEGVDELSPVTHGNAVSVYFRDPEGNRLEIFVDSPWYVAQPLRVPVDLDRPDEEIWQFVEKTCRQLPGFKSRQEWEAEMRSRMNP